MAIARARARPSLPSLADRWYRFRNRLLRDQGFQRWAARFPLTRSLARKRTRSLFDLCAGFVYSQVLLACVRLGLFDHLAEQPKTITDLAVAVDLPLDAATRLVTAARSLDLLELKCRDEEGQDRYGLGQLGAALLGNPGALAMVHHHPMLYGDLADPVALLRGDRPETELSRYWPYAGAARPAELNADRVEAYSALMSASQHLVAEDIIDAYPLRRHRRLLDVGGGDGTFLTSVARRAPNLQLCLFDLPAVAALARARFEAAGIADRAEAIGGDFLSDPLPDGADIATLVRILHDHDDARVRLILRAVHRALRPDGVLLVAEPMAATAGAESLDAYFGFYLLAMGRGRPRTSGELSVLVSEAGFSRVRVVHTPRPLLTGLIKARATPSNC